MYHQQPEGRVEILKEIPHHPVLQHGQQKRLALSSCIKNWTISSTSHSSCLEMHQAQKEPVHLSKGASGPSSSSGTCQLHSAYSGRGLSPPLPARTSASSHLRSTNTIMFKTKTGAEATKRPGRSRQNSEVSTASALHHPGLANV